MKPLAILNVLDLFSGIGGFSLGLERTNGFRTVAFCEIDPYCRKVLAKHWPSVPCYDDIRTLTAERLAANAATGDVQIDVICGGFPCQDISIGGRKAGISGSRSGLWKEYFRLIREIRPRFSIMENVGALAFRGLETVLADLTEIGFDAEWQTVSASSVGAPHARDRVWIVAYPKREGLSGFEPIWPSVCRQSRETPTEFGNEIIHCGLEWPMLGPYLRMGDGIPRPVDEVKSLGNSVLPQIPEIIGNAILTANNP
jgi:DNA (cytosine-5)-methyltransferase 1